MKAPTISAATMRERSMSVKATDALPAFTLPLLKHAAYFGVEYIQCGNERANTKFLSINNKNIYNKTC